MLSAISSRGHVAAAAAACSFPLFLISIWPAEAALIGGSGDGAIKISLIARRRGNIAWPDVDPPRCPGPTRLPSSSPPPRLLPVRTVNTAARGRQQDRKCIVVFFLTSGDQCPVNKRSVRTRLSRNVRLSGFDRYCDEKCSSRLRRRNGTDVRVWLSQSLTSSRLQFYSIRLPVRARAKHYLNYYQYFNTVHCFCVMISVRQYSLCRVGKQQPSVPKFARYYD